MAIITMYVDAAELDNGDVESKNAVLRRRVKHCLQQKALELADLSGSWIFNDARAEASWFGGAPLPTNTVQVVPEEPKMKAGGGGLCRGFMSEYRDEFKDAKGQVSLADVRAAYNAETQLPHSEKLEAIRDKSAAATKAARETFRQHGAHARGALSSFGRFRTKKPSVSLKSKYEAQMLLDEFSTSMAQGLGPRQIVGSRQIVAAHNVLHDVLCTRVSGELEDQLQVLRRAARLESIQQKAKEREETQELSALVCAPCNAAGIDFSQVQISSGALRAMPGKVPRLVLTDNALDVSLGVAANMLKKHDKTMSEVIETYEEVHVMIAQDSLHPIGEIKQRFLPSVCQKEGHGVCICNNSEHGLVKALARRAFARALCRLCPAKTAMRRFLSEGRIVVYVPGPEAWVHCALMYFNPRRPTLVMMQDRGEALWGFAKLRAQFKGAGELDCRTDVEFVSKLPLESKLGLELFRLLAFERRINRFTPGEYLIVGRIERKHLSNGDKYDFWPGSAVALEERRKELEKKQADEARRRARAQAQGDDSRKRKRSTPASEAKPSGSRRRRNAGAAVVSARDASESASCPVNEIAAGDAELFFSSGEDNYDVVAAVEDSSSEDEATKDMNKAYHIEEDNLVDSDSSLENVGAARKLLDDLLEDDLLESSSEEDIDVVEPNGPLSLEVELAACMPGVEDMEAKSPSSLVRPEAGTPILESPDQRADGDGGYTPTSGPTSPTSATETTSPRGGSAAVVSPAVGPAMETEGPPHEAGTLGESDRELSVDGELDHAGGDATGRGATPTVSSEDEPLPSYTPTSKATSSRGLSVDRDSSRSRASSGRTPDAAVERPSAAPRGARGRATDDRQAHIPAGCTMRRYEPEGVVPAYWLGVLPVGVVDEDGRHSRQRAFRAGLRTEAEAIDQIETWFRKVMQDRSDTEDSGRAA